MSNVLKQSVRFKGVTARRLFEIYTDSRLHGAAVGAPASIGKGDGGEFWVFRGDAVRGRNLYVVPGAMVVQRWRSGLFSAGDPDSILTLLFSDADGGARIDLIQANIPDRLLDNTREGWRKMYWAPWRAYIRENAPPPGRAGRRGRR